MTEISSHTDPSMLSPFQVEIDLEHYYASESSKRVLLTINQAVAEGVRLMVLTGDEGSGKTMLCNKLDSDMREVFTTVFFQQTANSFEDVVRIVARGLGADLKQDSANQTVDMLLGKISEALVQSDLPLLLIFDEAENIYLATLERIRKMLDRLSGDGGRIHVLFAGRKTFLENCQQLSMCEFDNDEEYQITLEPLLKEETEAYIHHCGQKIPEIDKAAIFTPDVVKTICEISRGNFRMVNMLAEEALLKGGGDTSFPVLLENVKKDAGRKRKSGGFVPLVREYLQQYRSYIPYAVVFVGMLCISFIFLVSNDSDDNNITQEQPAAPGFEIEEPVVIKIESAEKRADGDIASSVKVPNVVSEQKITPPLAQSVEEEEAETALPREQLPEVEIDVEQQTKFSPPEMKVVSQNEEKPQPVIVVKKVKPTEVAPVIETVQKQQKVIKVVTLKRESKTKKRPGKLPKTTQVTIKEEIRKEKKRNVVREVIASNAHFTVDQLYKKRLMAGSSWYNNQKNDKYTVQVMVLTSKTAESNLKKLLRKDRYRQEAGNFYIFRKLSTSDTLFVFYGEYATIAQARLAQNSLPRFLRDHKPYAISIKGAMAKVRR